MLRCCPRLAACAALLTALALATPMAYATAQEASPGGPVSVAAIVAGPRGPVVEQHTAASPQEGRRLLSALQARDDVVAAEVDVPVRAVQTEPEPSEPEPEPIEPEPSEPEPIQPDPVEPDPGGEEPEPTEPLRSSQWALDRLRAEEAWEVSDARDRVIAVIDSGVDATHPDLAGVVLDGMDVFQPETRGRTDPLTPCSGASSECRGHGTHVAGIIAAVSADGSGIAGLARGASILPIRVLDPAGYGESSDVARGLIYAADRHADVINLSLGSTERSALVEFAVSYATRRGALVVAAAGNMGPFSPPLHPAADPWVVAVGATDRNDQVPRFSGQGQWLDLVAPGVDIWSTRPGDDDDRYGTDSGTSMATPYVAAAAALVQSRRPGLAPAEVAAHLRATATGLPPAGRDPATGDGLVNPLAALTRTPAAASVCDPSRVPPSTFADAGSGVHRPNVDCVVWYGVAQGTSPSTYNPAGQVTRAQMASFIARMLDRSGVRLPPPGGQRFSDVRPANVHRGAINSLAAAGIVQGQPGGTYAPNQVVTRDQMASFLVRAYDYAQQEIGRAQLAAAARRFGDTAGNTHEPNINKSAAAGFATGVSATEYAPRQGVRRDQMATFVIRVMERLN